MIKKHEAKSQQGCSLILFWRCPSKQNKLTHFWSHRKLLTQCAPATRASVRSEVDGVQSRLSADQTKVRGIISIGHFDVNLKFSPPCLVTAWNSWIVNQGIWKSIFQLKKSCFDFLDWILINPEWISFRIEYTKKLAFWRNKSIDSLVQENPADTNFQSLKSKL